ncbi:hypothetical protein EV702DRAFT_1047264 [Suillus placidus]|uniref:Uncharacterized protein n=1 Tax=Suillus placidus TaxID=48579 RepID=A0A9P6ZQP7_9AGAM|nr:hypothetical protein EV702DRAFT_1047264 [Suillus placidus]
MVVAVIHIGVATPVIIFITQEIRKEAQQAWSILSVLNSHTNVEKESDIPPSNFVETRLVICAHDKMTTQANNGQSMSWVPYAHTIKYSKNYERYWNGEMFVAQGKLCCLTRM